MLNATFRRAPALLVHLIFIGAVSLYDAWLVIDLSEEILSNERNAVGRYLIRLTEGDVTLFVACKLAGTAGALSILAWLGKHYLHLAMPVARSMSIFQLWLLWFLTCSVAVDPLMPTTIGAACLGIVASCLAPFISQDVGVAGRRLRIAATRHLSRRRRAQREAQLAGGM